MTPRITRKRLVLAAAGVFVAFVVILLVYPGGKPTAPEVHITAIRTIGGGVITVVVPRPYAITTPILMPAAGQPAIRIDYDYRVKSVRIANGLKMTLEVLFEPEGPYQVYFLLDAPTEGLEGFAGRIKSCVELWDPSCLFRPYYGGVPRHRVQLVVFGDDDPEGFTNRVVQTTKRRRSGH